MERIITWSLLGLVGLWVPFCLPVAAANDDGDGLDSMSSLPWDHRVLIVAQSAYPDADLDALERAAPAIRERDLIWFFQRGDEVISNYPGKISDRLGSEISERYAEESPVILLGKDGGVKMREDRLTLSEVFARIDSMPMRQLEMRRSE